MGVTFKSAGENPGNHLGAFRALSLPPSELLKDPLAAVKHQHQHQHHRPSLHGIFQDRLSGPLASLQKPPTPRLPARRSKSEREPRNARVSWATVAVPLNNKENVEVREAYRRVSSDGSWSGDLIRLSSALDQLAALCHNAPQKSSVHRKKSGLYRSPDPYYPQEEYRNKQDSFNQGIAYSNAPTSFDSNPTAFLYGYNNNNNNINSNNNNVNQGKFCYNNVSSNLYKGEQQNGSSDFLDTPIGGVGALDAPYERDWSPDHAPVSSCESETGPPPPPFGRPPLQLPPCPVGALRSSLGVMPSPMNIGMTRKMGIVLRALGEKLAAWGRGEAAMAASLGSQGSAASTSSSPLSGRHQVQTTPTPSPSQPNGTIMPRKVVVALYDYNAAQSGDLCLRKNEEFDVLDDSEEHWWKMRDNEGREGYAPSNYVREKGNLGLQQYDWYLGDASRQRAEAILMREEKEGCFVVRNSTTNSGIYTLSVFSKMSRVQVKHYHIKTDPDGLFYLSNSIKCPTIPELIYRHQHNPGGLCTRLRNPPSQGRQAPTTAGLSHDKWEIVPSELNLLEELGSGQFGVVRHGKLYGIDVAVKMMKEGTMSEDEFIEEAKVMTKLQHPNLVQLYGVCRRKRPIYIVTEYLKHGSLLNYLRNKEKTIIQKSDVLLDMCLQVCEGMAYLEGQKFIHRDLAARNCLVGSNNVIKVGDFGLARYVVDDEYTGSGGAKFPIKWAAPEVLNYMRFSSKSDVWAFGVLIWEVFTCGKMPYGRHKNAEVVEMVQQGKVLERPRFCPPEVYEVMRKSWLHSQEQRPGFQDIKIEIMKVVKNIAE